MYQVLYASGIQDPLEVKTRPLIRVADRAVRLRIDNADSIILVGPDRIVGYVPTKAVSYLRDWIVHEALRAEYPRLANLSSVTVTLAGHVWPGRGGPAPAACHRIFSTNEVEPAYDVSADWPQIAALLAEEEAATGLRYELSIDRRFHITWPVDTRAVTYWTLSTGWRADWTRYRAVLRADPLYRILQLQQLWTLLPCGPELPTDLCANLAARLGELLPPAPPLSRDVRVDWSNWPYPASEVMPYIRSWVAHYDVHYTLEVRDRSVIVTLDFCDEIALRRFVLHGHRPRNQEDQRRFAKQFAEHQDYLQQNALLHLWRINRLALRLCDRLVLPQAQQPEDNIKTLFNYYWWQPDGGGAALAAAQFRALVV